jgi:hypothetical protein
VLRMSEEQAFPVILDSALAHTKALGYLLILTALHSRVGEELRLQRKLLRFGERTESFAFSVARK